MLLLTVFEKIALYIIIHVQVLENTWERECVESLGGQ